MKLNWEGLLPITGIVIVIEDDQTLRLLMVDILKEIGAQSLAFETADDALTYLLEAHAPCPLVVVDHALPGQIQGAEFIEMVKGKWPSTGSILISGYLLEPATVPHSTRYLQKPWSLDDFVVAVAQVLQPGYPLRKN
ncbi:MAG: response regulator [Pseudomonas sp.]|uniref:response regulator n=1 Tax=Pseudomonas sp. TaxID=306 RepID=UPI0023A50B75|nr:response regulator [Pseudomonas sp.]MDE1910080.1 response regulator [Pseudomonas sp.]MDE2193333.1 response regulator [Pseudomonas sp.]MDQ3596268.1 response regulator [Pseudomonadota bacterium]